MWGVDEILILGVCVGRGRGGRQMDYFVMVNGARRAWECVENGRGPTGEGRILRLQLTPIPTSRLHSTIHALYIGHM